MNAAAPFLPGLASSSDTIEEGDLVIDTLSGEHRRVKRLLRGGVGHLVIGAAIAVPGKPEQYRALHELRKVETV